MKILSIDLDFISAPAINEMYATGFTQESDNLPDLDDQPVMKWRRLLEFNKEIFDNVQDQIDIDNYQFCFRTFLRALKHCDDVYFGYDHDNILYGLEGHTDIEVVNIDHHSDILTNAYEHHTKEMHWVDTENRVTEGNWGYWLQSQGRLKSFHWILNPTSEEHGDTKLGEMILNNFTWSTKDDYDFGDYKFDQIYVCLSPGYIPPLQWHMMGSFTAVYEELTGKKINVDDLHRKYEYTKYYEGVSKSIRVVY